VSFPPAPGGASVDTSLARDEPLGLRTRGESIMDGAPTVPSKAGMRSPPSGFANSPARGPRLTGLLTNCPWRTERERTGGVSRRFGPFRRVLW
jgi:hypothetical protein